MSKLPKIVRARLGSQPITGHPDADVLTAFYEQALPETERVPVLAHLSHCADCREVVALALPPQTEAHVRVTKEPASLWNWPLVRWASLAACLVVVGAAVLIHPKPGPEAVRPSTEDEVASVERSAESAAKAESADKDDKVAAHATPPAQQSVRAEEAAKKKEEPPKQKDTTASVEKRTPPPARQEAAKTLAQPTRDDTRDRDSNGTFDRPTTAPVIAGNMRATTNQPVSGHASAAMAPAPAWKAQIATANQMATEKNVSEDESKSSEALSAKAPETPGRAKAATGGASGAASAQSGATKEDLAKQADEMDPSSRLRTAQVMLSSDGQLQRSFDSGATWEPAPVVERVKFTALSVVGRDVWAGGTAGLLYHSTDSGNHWTPVKPSVGGTVLSADIKSLHFTDLQHGTLTTADGQQWSTADGGRNWQKAP
jgi:hypothetical protein